MTRPTKDDGFTLVEVLVALVVTGLLLSVIFQGAFLAMERLRFTADRRQARIDGRFLLAHLSAEEFTGMRRTGTAGALRWISRESVIRTDPRQILASVRLDVRVTGPRGAVLYDGTAVRLKAMPER